ncbi:MAG: flagellin [Sulfuricurvum sp.]|uniref:flagellin N-terminal helical domain-containing protein n=1 Tax=Sulfuricurvum sp. TaxID=2025608 RepID=UPI002734D64E|nr:flagellin [Sulfuricurvum sp.]MDP2849949.1 flagellin [Sulfuricurvum sp.]
MGFRINTNIAAMNAHTNSTVNNRSLDDSLSKLSSGLRINKAADDASGMVIADSLRTQANSLGQAISNANDGIGIIQVADKAMDEQLKILDTIKTKAIQAGSDSQSTSSRTAIQKDVNRLLEQLDNIAKTTAFNGTQLLSGNFSNKEFQVGAYSNQTIKASIANTQSLAIGNTSTKVDQVQVGNFATSTLAHPLDKNATVLTFTGADGINAQGLAAGDTIRIDGVGDFTIQHISGTMTTAGTMSGIAITLDRALGKTVSVGSSFGVSLVKTTAENLSTFSPAAVTGGVTMTTNSSNINGFAIGDKMNVTISDGSSLVYTLVSVAGASTGTTSGVLIWSAAAAGTAGVISLATVSVNDRASMGTDFTSADYAQYTIEGVKLDGVQMTDSSGNGVAQSGLGRIADLINAASGQTGVKAVANTEINSNIAVQGGTLLSNITINGTTILSSGASILSSDTDNTLVTAINDKTSLTGVTASLESDGTLTLSSDGRAVNLSGMSAAAGLNDGVYAGRLELVKQGGGDITVSSSHFSNSGLTASLTTAKALTDTTSSSVLSDLIYGQVDDNNDGLVNTSDKVGLLLTREGATKAMDITESAIARLDAIRADLGSVQNQLVVTVNNIAVTQVNVRAAESQIRDVDFAAESANFSKFNILAQSGSYAMSQANAVQQNVLRLLQ